MLLSFPPEPPSQRKGAAKACAVKGAERRSEATRTLDRIASQERRNKRQDEARGDDKEIPPGGLEQNAFSLKLRLKERVTRHVPTQNPPHGGRDARKLASAPTRAALVMQGYPQR